MSVEPLADAAMPATRGGWRMLRPGNGARGGQAREGVGPVVGAPVVEERRAARRRRDDGEEGQVVDVKARERHRVDLVDRGPELRRRDGGVGQPGGAVAGAVLRG